MVVDFYAYKSTGRQMTPEEYFHFINNIMQDASGWLYKSVWDVEVFIYDEYYGF